MWSSLDVVLGIAFMVAWVIAVAAGSTAIVTAYCLFVGRRMAANDVGRQ